MMREYKMPYLSFFFLLRDKNKCNLVTHWLIKVELLVMQKITSKLSVQATDLETDILGGNGSKIP